MNKQQAINAAVSAINRTSMPVDDWLHRIATDPNYKYKNTKTYAALKFLEQTKPRPATLKPPHPPPLSDKYLDVVRRCLFLTSDVGKALTCRDRLLIATADLSYRHCYTQWFIKTAMSQNRFRVWCDCRPIGTGTPPEVALQWLHDLGLPDSYFYGQCESVDEFNMAYNAGTRNMVGKLSALNEDQRAKIRNKEVLITNEAYYNVELPHNANYTPNWYNVNPGIGGNCVAVYESASEGSVYYSLADQAKDGRYNPDTDCVYVAGFTDADWDYLVSH